MAGQSVAMAVPAAEAMVVVERVVDQEAGRVAAVKEEGKGAVGKEESTVAAMAEGAEMAGEAMAGATVEDLDKEDPSVVAMAAVTVVIVAAWAWWVGGDTQMAERPCSSRLSTGLQRLQGNPHLCQSRRVGPVTSLNTGGPVSVSAESSRHHAPISTCPRHRDRYHQAIHHPLHSHSLRSSQPTESPDMHSSPWPTNRRCRSSKKRHLAKAAPQQSPRRPDCLVQPAEPLVVEQEED